MEHPATAIYDANVLYPAPLRDLFVRLAQAGLVRARWTDAITTSGCATSRRTTRACPQSVCPEPGP